LCVGSFESAGGEPGDRDRCGEDGGGDAGEPGAGMELIVGEDGAPTLVGVLVGERKCTQYADEQQRDDPGASGY